MTDHTVSENTLENLAARVEAATGPDRELDGRIWCVVGIGSPWTAENSWLAATPRPPELDSMGLTLEQWLDKWPEQAAAMVDNYNVPKFTASLDAAMTLVPEGMMWVGGLSPSRGAHMAICPDGQTDGVTGVAATPALALTAACLRARRNQP